MPVLALGLERVTWPAALVEVARVEEARNAHIRRQATAMGRFAQVASSSLAVGHMTYSNC